MCNCHPPAYMQCFTIVVLQVTNKMNRLREIIVTVIRALGQQLWWKIILRPMCHELRMCEVRS